MSVSSPTSTTPATSIRPGFSSGTNWIGLWTLYLKEVRRFTNVYTQTLAAPVGSALLFLAVFALALGGDRKVEGVSYAVFLVPGLTIMTMVQNAFANTSSSIMIGKIQGSIVDVLMPPLSAAELTLGYALAGVTRGIVIGFAVGGVLYLFVPFTIDNWGLVVFHGVMGSMLLALFGIIGALWSVKFDHIAAVTNFVVTPLSFLSGTFYSIDRLPEVPRAIARYNPLFYMIDGFRSGFIGGHDDLMWLGVVVVIATNVALFALTWRLFAIGYKLKA